MPKRRKATAVGFHPYSGSRLRCEWKSAYAEYDLEEANRRLDEIGLTERDDEDTRLGPDDNPVVITTITCTDYSPSSVDVSEIAVEQWKAIGIKAL